MRDTDPTAAAVLGSSAVPLALLIYMGLSEPVYRTTAGMPITFSGATYLPLGDVGGVAPVENTPGDTKGLKFQLAGVRNELLAIALQEQIRNKRVVLYLAVLSPATHQVLDVLPMWSGTFDQMPITFGSNSSVINATAEHRGATFARPKPLRYNDSDQRRDHAGDTCLRFLPAQANHLDVWPSAAWGRQ